MNDPHEKRREAVALFRYGLIAELLHIPPGSRGIGERLIQKAEASYSIPFSPRGRVAAETLRHWLKAYRKNGFDGLRPRPRKDAGSSHALPTNVVDFLCDLKERHPGLSVQLIIKEAQASGEVPEGLPLPASTVHRLLSRKGLMKKRETAGKDHRRFEFESANDLWMSDVMHGPSVGVGGNIKRKSYLIALIDDATRVIPFASFALSENTASLLPVLKQAVMRRGVPKRLYVDNGAAFRSHYLELVCAKLGITLIHARPYHPEGKGKQERWFRTVRMQFLPRLTSQDLSSVEALNRKLWAYIEGEYHQSPHKGLDDITPLDAWVERARHVKHVGGNKDIEEVFLFEQKRKVARDRTVSLNSVVYEVDATLVGETVTLRYDPERPRGVIQVFSKGVRAPDAKPLDAHANCFVQRARTKIDASAEATASSLRISEFVRNSKETR